MCQRWETLSRCMTSAVTRAVSSRTAAVDLDESLESLTAQLNNIHVRLTRLHHFSDDKNTDAKLAHLSVSIMMLR